MSKAQTQPKNQWDLNRSSLKWYEISGVYNIDDFSEWDFSLVYLILIIVDNESCLIAANVLLHVLADFESIMKLVTCGCLNVKIHIKNSDLKPVELSSIGEWTETTWKQLLYEGKILLTKIGKLKGNIKHIWSVTYISNERLPVE